MVPVDVIDPSWIRPADGLYCGASVVCGGGNGPKILVSTNSLERHFHALHDARDLHTWETIIKEVQVAHRVKEKLRHPSNQRVAYVSHVRWDPDPPPGRFEPSVYEPTFTYEVVDLVEVFDTTSRINNSLGELVDVPTIQLFGDDFIVTQQRIEQAKKADAEWRADREAQISRMAGQLEVPKGYISVVGRPNRAKLAVTVHEFAQLLERAERDPEWAARVKAEGALEALGQLGT